MGVGRPFALVFVVFYWIFTGLAAVVGSLALSLATGVLSGLASQLGRAELRELDAATKAFLVLCLLELVGVFLFVYGLLLFVSCYGLWTFRRWGLRLGRGLAVIGLVLSFAACSLSVYQRAGIVWSLASFLLSLGILVDLNKSFGLDEETWAE